MLALWVDFPYHFACRRRRRSTVPAFPGLLVPCVRRTSHSISSENCTAAGSEMEHVFARAASAGRPAIAGRFEFVTPPLLLPLRLSVPPLQDLLSSAVGGYRGRRCYRGCPVAASRCAEKPVRSASFSVVFAATPATFVQKMLQCLALAEKMKISLSPKNWPA